MRHQKTAWIVLGAAFCLVASQAAIAPSVGGLLRRNMERQAVEFRSLEVSIAPLGWFSLLRGRLGRVTIAARQISFGGPRLARLEMRLTGLQLSPGRLFLHGEALAVGLGPSTVLARVEAAALNDYRRRAYPSIPAFFRISRDQVGLVGSLRILGRDVSVQTFGHLQAEGDRLRYVPRAIEVAGRSVPATWLASYGGDLALEIPLVLPLPLLLREVRLGDGYVDLVWTETRRSAGRVTP